jgi:phosphoglycolate phosphatase-like HAD superfamily hydrolase
VPALVIFDHDNVVVRYDRGKRVAAMASALGRTEDEVWAAVFGSGLEDATVAGLVPTVLLTNNGALLREELATVSPAVAALGLPFHASGDLGVAKPDPEVYRRVAALHGAAPGDTLFVDDSPDYVAGALRAGVRAHLFTGYDGAVAFLAAEGVPVVG